jgi:tetratricopeptide (TPR) repeat protein
VSLLRGVTTLPTCARLSAPGLALLAAAATAWGQVPAQPDTPPVSGDRATSAAAPDARTEAHDQFKRLLEAGDFAAAAEQAGRVVELTERDAPGQSEELQVALMNLALAQHRAGEYLAAEASYQRVIGLVEASGRLTSPRLARAHAGLATTYYAARRYDLAAAEFERAIALNRRSEGLFNEAQLPLLEKQADSLVELGRFEDALRARRYALNVVGRRHGERSLPFARELQSLGRWYTRVGSYEASRATLRKSVELYAALSGPASIDLVEPLAALAENARRWLQDPQFREAAALDPERNVMFHDTPMPTPPTLSASTIASEAQKALEAAASIAAASPDAPPALVAGVRAQLGDWYVVREQPERALPHYRQAWLVAGTAADGAALRQSLFGTPVLLGYLAPESWNRHAQRPPDEVEVRHVDIELTVTARGGVREPRPVGGTDEGRLVSQALRAVQTARYRPRLEGGEPAETAGVRFTQPFYVLRETEPAGPTDPPPATAPPPLGGG